jgi:hypothetical protein
MAAPRVRSWVYRPSVQETETQTVACTSEVCWSCGNRGEPHKVVLGHWRCDACAVSWGSHKTEDRPRRDHTVFKQVSDEQ